MADTGGEKVRIGYYTLDDKALYVCCRLLAICVLVKLIFDSLAYYLTSHDVWTIVLGVVVLCASCSIIYFIVSDEVRKRNLGIAGDAVEVMRETTTDAHGMEHDRVTIASLIDAPIEANADALLERMEDADNDFAADVYSLDHADDEKGEDE